jgi:SAM-dependent methyltransferase
MTEPKKMKASNRDLQGHYNRVYADGSAGYFTFDYFSESLLVFSMLKSWKGLRVLEIGCGEGRLAALIGMAGADQVEAIDYSEEAIEVARKRFHLDNVSFACCDFHKVQGQYDAVVLQGVVEHLDHPFENLRWLFEKLIVPGGCLITSSPSFLNPRGYVWMTLNLLLDVPMSLSDLHFLCPFDFERFADELNSPLTVKSTDQDWGAGKRLLLDFQKRLPNALADAGLPTSGVPRLLEWLSHATPYFNEDDYSGVNVAYRLDKPL